MKNKLLLFAFASLFATGCSTVYDNTVGLFYGDEDSMPAKEAASAESATGETSASASDPTSLSNTSERIAAASSGTTSVPIEGPPVDTATDEVEVLWKIPEEPVEGFVLKYGFQRETLSEEINLNLSQVEKYDDPEFGFVYRYILKGVPPAKAVFVRLATKTDGKITPFSEVFEVAAE